MNSREVVSGGRQSYSRQLHKLSLRWTAALLCSSFELLFCELYMSLVVLWIVGFYMLIFIGLSDSFTIQFFCSGYFILVWIIDFCTWCILHCIFHANQTTEYPLNRNLLRFSNWRSTLRVRFFIKFKFYLDLLTLLKRK